MRAGRPISIDLHVARTRPAGWGGSSRVARADSSARRDRYARLARPGDRRRPTGVSRRWWQLLALICCLVTHQRSARASVRLLSDNTHTFHLALMISIRTRVVQVPIASSPLVHVARRPRRHLGRRSADLRSDIWRARHKCRLVQGDACAA